MVIKKSENTAKSHDAMPLESRILGNIPSGHPVLAEIIDAMRKRTVIGFICRTKVANPFIE